MITIDPLYLLLLIELAALSVAAVVFLIFRSRKIRKLYREAITELVGVRQAMEELKQKFAGVSRDAARATSDTPGSRGPKSVRREEEGELEDLKTRLAESGEQLKEKTRLLAQLQAKFDDLEKEYLILYHQQQKNQPTPDSPGSG